MYGPHWSQQDMDATMATRSTDAMETQMDVSMDLGGFITADEEEAPMELGEFTVADVTATAATLPNSIAHLSFETVDQALSHVSYLQGEVDAMRAQAEARFTETVELRERLDAYQAEVNLFTQTSREQSAMLEESREENARLQNVLLVRTNALDELRSRFDSERDAIREYVVEKNRDGTICREGTNEFLAEFGMPEITNTYRVDFVIRGHVIVESSDASASDVRYDVQGNLGIDTSEVDDATDSDFEVEHVSIDYA